MIITVTCNPALDKTVHTEKIDYGRVNRVTNVREDLGGKGLNVGRITEAFELPTKNLIFLGDENKNHIIEYLEKDNMTYDYVTAKGHTRTNIKIVETKKVRTTDINEAGMYVNKEKENAFIEKIQKEAKNADYLVMAGSLPKGINADFYARVGKLLPKTKLVIDADADVLLTSLKSKPYIIKPNLHELESILDTKLTTLEEIVNAGQKIVEEYGVTICLISMGKEGALLVTKEEVIKAEAIPTKVVSTVGAGDSILAGFLYGLQMKMKLKDALSFGSACSAKTISTEGYPKLKKKEIIELQQKAKVNHI